jgi:hypothetical protein
MAQQGPNPTLPLGDPNPQNGQQDTAASAGLPALSSGLPAGSSGAPAGGIPPTSAAVLISASNAPIPPVSNPPVSNPPVNPIPLSSGSGLPTSNPIPGAGIGFDPNQPFTSNPGFQLSHVQNTPQGMYIIPSVTQLLQQQYLAQQMGAGPSNYWQLAGHQPQQNIPAVMINPVSHPAAMGAAGTTYIPVSAPTTTGAHAPTATVTPQTSVVTIQPPGYVPLSMPQPASQPSGDPLQPSFPIQNPPAPNYVPFVQPGQNPAGGYHAVPPPNRLYAQPSGMNPAHMFPNMPPPNPQVVPVPQNPNLPPGFGPQNFQIGGIRTNLGTIGRLGEDLHWDEWLMRVEGQLNCNWWAYLVDDPNCPPFVWNIVKMWVIQWLNKADSQLVLRCNSWKEAKDKIRRNHSPDDDTTVNHINELLMGARLGASESPASLINRILDLNATLESLNHGWTEAQLVTAITKALKANTHHDQVIRTLKSIGGHLTLRSIQNAFNANIAAITVPGAFLTEDVPRYPDRIDQLAESVATLAKTFKNSQQPFKKARFPSSQSKSPQRRDDKVKPKFGPRFDKRDRSRSPGPRGRTPPRGRGPARAPVKPGEKCFNCGMNNHKVDACRNPCGMCGKKDHKASQCIMNPKSDRYIPPYKRRNPNAGPNRPPGKALISSTEDDHQYGDEAQAMQAMGGEYFQFHPDFMSEEEGKDPDFPDEPNPPESYMYDLGIASKASVLRPRDTAGGWVVDSGASHHFTPSRELLFDYKPDDPAHPVRVKVANQMYASRAGVGHIIVEPSVEGSEGPNPQYMIKEVWHMPTFSHSLLSTNKLQDDGNWFFSGQAEGDKNLYFLKKGTNRIWLTCKRGKTLNYPDWKIMCASRIKDASVASYSTTGAPAPTQTGARAPVIPESEPQEHFIAASANRATDKETPELWHQRLGHVRMSDLQSLVRNNSITGIKVPASKLGKHTSIKCQTCVMAKFNRAKFKARERTEEVMHTLHSDITGPWSTPSLGGGLYVISLLDEASGNGAVSIIKSKSAGPDEIRRLILLWEAKTGKKCKVLFTDRGGEYVGTELKEWCLNRGILHYYSTPRTPQQNGRAERFNQTIANIMRSLMFNYKLHDSLWGMAMIYACEIYNVMLSKRHGKTRSEVFLGSPPDVSNFRTFGCKVYARVADSARTKLEPKYQLGMFLGPEQEGPGYKVLTYNPKLKKDKYQVRIFRDIICYEKLTAVTGAQDESQLHWGGHIPLPEGEEIIPPPPELEPLTGVPEPQVDPVPNLVASGGEFPDSGGQQPILNLPEPEGARPPTEPSVMGTGPAQLTAPQTPLQLAGEPAQSVEQQKTSPTVAGSDKTVVTPGKTVTKGPAVPTQKVKPPSKPKPLPRVGGSTQQHPVKKQTPKISPAQKQSGNGVVSKTQKTTVQTPKPTHIVPPKTPIIVNRPVSPQPIVRILNTKPVAPAAVPKPATAHVRRAPAPPAQPGTGPGTSAPSKKVTIQTPASSVQPRTTYNLRPRSVSPVSRTPPAQKPTPPPSKSVGVTPTPILRKGVAFLSANSAIPLPVGYTVVEPTAFLASCPFKEPDFAAFEIEKPDKESMVRELMRHFGVEDKFEGPVPVWNQETDKTPPKTLKQAMATPFAKEWAEAAVEEWLSLVSNNTWTLVEREPWMKVIPCKWIFTVKTLHDGSLDRFKARLVAGGHRQVEGVDYNETYAPVSKHATLRTLFAVAANRGWSVQQLDIKTAFLHGDVDSEVYMMQPVGFIDGVNNVVVMNKSIYGLKQAPKIWYETLNAALTAINFEAVAADQSFWIKTDGPHKVYLTSVVDDMLVTSENEAYSKQIVDQILSKFPGKPCGEARQYNGMKVTWLRPKNSVILSQPKHVQTLVDKFSSVADLVQEKVLPVEPGVRLCKAGIVGQTESPPLDVSVYKYRELIGGLSYISCSTRPDISFIVNQLARYSNDPRQAHWDLAINVLKYLKHTQNWGISLGQGSALCEIDMKCAEDENLDNVSRKRKHAQTEPAPDVLAYSDANHGTGHDDKRSISGVILHVFGGPVSWSSKVQPVTSLSTCESEFRAMSTASREALWLQKILHLFDVPSVPFIIKGDNESAISSVKNYTTTKYTKHIAIHLDFMKDYYKKGVLHFVHVHGRYNPADVLTKALCRNKFEQFRFLLGMRPAMD